MFDDLVDVRSPLAFCEKGVEHHLTEGAIMIAFAMHLLQTVPDMKHVDIHPDGEHAKRFSFPSWFAAHGYERTKLQGTTSFGGVYESATTGRTILVNPKPGRCDVVADIAGRSFVAECKGGIINTRHAGQLSRLRRGLCEAVGLLLSQGAEAKPTR